MIVQVTRVARYRGRRSLILDVHPGVVLQCHHANLVTADAAPLTAAYHPSARS